MTLMLPSLAPDIVVAARVFGILLFVGALWGKVRHFEEFSGIVAQYDLLPLSLARIGALCVVIAEIATISGLAIDALVPSATMLAIILLVIFTGAIAINLARGKTAIECGCFRTALRQPLSISLLWRNALCISLIMFAAFPANATISLASLLSGAIAGFCCFALIMAFTTILSLHEQGLEFRRRYSR